jgi:hypothetical protein
MNLFFENKQLIKHSTFMLCNVNDSSFADNDQTLSQTNAFLHNKTRLPTSLELQYGDSWNKEQRLMSEYQQFSPD